MKLRKTGRIAIAGLAVAAALTMTACGGDDKDSDKPAKSTTTSQSTTAADEAVPPAPTAEELNTKLQRALDPNVPNEEKLNMIQGAEADPNLPATLTQVYRDSGAQITVTGVEAYGDVLNAIVDFTLNGQTNTGQKVPFVVEDGVWKVQQDWTCNMLKLASVQSPACPAA